MAADLKSRMAHQVNLAACYMAGYFSNVNSEPLRSGARHLHESVAVVLMVLLLPLAARAQGIVQFRNFDTATGLNAPVFRNISSDQTSIPVSGTDYTAELMAGPSLTNMQSIAVTPFLSGARAGYFDGGVQSIPGVSSGKSAVISVRVWATWAGSFANAQAAGIGSTWGSYPTFTTTSGTSNAPAALSPLRAFWLNPFLDYSPAIFANYNRVNGTVEVSCMDILQVSSDLVHWADATNGTDFPLNQPQQFFRARLARPQ